MNRNITLILSAVLVVVLLGIWIYLVFFADRSTETEVIEGSGEFAQFDNLGSDAPAPGPGPDSDSDGVENTDAGQTGFGNGIGPDGTPDILRQLTTKQVVGYTEVDIASTTYALFVESGVGHIYSINLSSGVEERVSATTIPDARAAAFSNDGSQVLVKTGNDTGYNPLSRAVIDPNTQSVELFAVADSVGTFRFTESGDILYTSVTNSSVVTELYDIETGDTKTVFTTPFREAVVELGATAAGPHIFYPKTSYELEGFVYLVEGGDLTRLPLDGFGLTAELVGDTVVATYRNLSELEAVAFDLATEEVLELETVVLADKCVTTNNTLLCAKQTGKTMRYDVINNWLRGTELFSDSLWELGSEAGVELINIMSQSGRQVDVINGLIGGESGDWYFQNKIDNSLWVYDVATEEPTTEPETE